MDKIRLFKFTNEDGEIREISVTTKSGTAVHFGFKDSSEGFVSLWTEFFTHLQISVPSWVIGAILDALIIGAEKEGIEIETGSG